MDRRTGKALGPLESRWLATDGAPNRQNGDFSLRGIVDVVDVVLGGGEEKSPQPWDLGKRVPQSNIGCFT
jgi:hypothetical protein